MTKLPDIDCTEFGELGVPSLLQAYRHQTRMLIDELDEAWLEVRKVKGDARKLVRMNDELSAKLAKVNAELGRVRREMSEHLRMGALRETARLNPMGSAHSIGYPKKP